MEARHGKPTWKTDVENRRQVKADKASKLINPAAG